MSVGRVFQRAFSAIRLNPVVILGLALIVGALPNLIMTYLFVQMGLVTSTEAVRIGAISPTRIIWVSLLSGLIIMVIAALVQGSLTRAVVTANEGRRASFGESLGTVESFIEFRIEVTSLKSQNRPIRREVNWESAVSLP